jgi:hypothetical protein
VLTPVTVGACAKGQECPKWFYMGLSEKDYEALAANEAEMLRWKEETEFLLNYYEHAPVPPPPTK